jgi:hypothetical protein
VIDWRIHEAKLYLYLHAAKRRKEGSIFGMVQFLSAG